MHKSPQIKSPPAQISSQLSSGGGTLTVRTAPVRRRTARIRAARVRAARTLGLLVLLLMLLLILMLLMLGLLFPFPPGAKISLDMNFTRWLSPNYYSSVKEFVVW